MNKLIYRIFLNDEMVAEVPESPLYREVITSIINEILFTYDSDLTVNNVSILVGFYDDKGGWHSYGC